MNSFTGPLTITELDLDWRHWRIEAVLRYESGAGTIEVPPGFITDGASIPRPLWALLPSWGRYSRPAVVHDYLYECLRTGQPHPLAPDRRTADAIFFDAMVSCGVNTTMRWLIWLAVRVAGR